MLRAPMLFASLLTALAALSVAGSRSTVTLWVSTWSCLFAVASNSWVLAAPSIATADRRWPTRAGAPLALLVAALWLVVAPVACSVAALASTHDSQTHCACDGSLVGELPSLARAVGVWQFVVVVLCVWLGPSFVRETPRGLVCVRGPLAWPLDGRPRSRAG